MTLIHEYLTHCTGGLMGKPKSHARLHLMGKNKIVSKWAKTWRFVKKVEKYIITPQGLPHNHAFPTGVHYTHDLPHRSTCLSPPFRTHMPCASLLSYVTLCHIVRHGARQKWWCGTRRATPGMWSRSRRVSVSWLWSDRLRMVGL